jgi:hypothetical protein
MTAGGRRESSRPLLTPSRWALLEQRDIDLVRVCGRQAAHGESENQNGWEKGWTALRGSSGRTGSYHERHCRLLEMMVAVDCSVVHLQVVKRIDIESLRAVTSLDLGEGLFIDSHTS